MLVEDIIRNHADNLEFLLYMPDDLRVEYHKYRGCFDGDEEAAKTPKQWFCERLLTMPKSEQIAVLASTVLEHWLTFYSTGFIPGEDA